MLMFCTAKGKEQTGPQCERSRDEQDVEVWECQAAAAAAVYLDGGDVERRGNAKDGHDDRLVLLVDEDLHFSDVLFSRHLRDVLVGHVGFPGSEVSPESKFFICQTSDGSGMVSVAAAANEMVKMKNKL